MGLAEAGAAVDEQRVVAAGRRLGDRQRSRMGEPVRGAGDEGVEGVARDRLVGVTGSRPIRGGAVGGPARPAGRSIPQIEDHRPVGFGIAVIDLHLEDEVQVRIAGVGQSRVHQPPVALLDALADQLAGNREGDHGPGEVEALHVLERRAPHRVADLLRQRCGGLVPHLCCVVRHGQRPPSRRTRWPSVPPASSTVDPHLWTTNGEHRTVARALCGPQVAAEIRPVWRHRARPRRVERSGLSRGICLRVRATSVVPVTTETSGHRGVCPGSIPVDRAPRRWSPSEAHLSAEEAPSCTQARLPSPHVRPSRPGHRPVPAAQGPPSTLCMTMSGAGSAGSAIERSSAVSAPTDMPGEPVGSRSWHSTYRTSSTQQRSPSRGGSVRRSFATASDVDSGSRWASRRVRAGSHPVRISWWSVRSLQGPM